MTTTTFTKRSECSAEEALRYLQVYFATVDLVSEALGKFQILATDATTVSQRSLYRAKALEAERDLELLKNQRRGFLQDEVEICAPNKVAIQQAEESAQMLALTNADDEGAFLILKLFAKGLAAFWSLQSGRTY